jgi:hypothetical protein
MEAERVLAKTTVQRVAQLLSKPERWTKNHSALKADGVPVDPQNPEACAWCLSGALDAMKINGSADPAGFYKAHKTITQVITDRGFSSIPSFNDAHDTTLEDVQEVLEEADARI